jgi:hypothetical protein
MLTDSMLLDYSSSEPSAYVQNSTRVSSSLSDVPFLFFLPLNLDLKISGASCMELISIPTGKTLSLLVVQETSDFSI